MEVLCTQIVSNEIESQKFAQEFVNDFLRKESNFTIFFEGGLGAGKTFLTREMLYHLEIEQEIPSPTYTLVNEYECPEKRRFAHFDFYRLEKEDFFDRGLHEIAEDGSVSAFVEWPEKLPEVGKESFSGKKFTIQIEPVKMGMRKIVVLT